MIGIIIVSHSNLAKSMISAYELIGGKQNNVKAIGLYHGDGIIELKDRIEKAINEVDDGDGILGFVDFQGGSPYNIMLQILNEHSFPCVAGVNMPMLIEALSTREFVKDKRKLIKNCIKQGKIGIVDLQKIALNMNQSSKSQNEEF